MVEQTKPYGIFTFVEAGYYERYDYRNEQELHFVAVIHKIKGGKHTYLFEVNGSIKAESKPFTLTANREKTKWQDLLAFANRAYAQYVDKQQ